MKAISLIQPWATLWALGIKICETRSWPTQFRGEILIHASRSDSEQGQVLWQNPEIQAALRQRLGVPFPPSFSELPRGCIVGKVDIKACVLMTKEMLEFGAKIADIENDFPIYFTTQECMCGEWKKGRFAFVARGHTVIDEPMPARGKLGIWEYDPNEEARYRAEKEIERAEKIAKRARIAARRRRTKQEQQPLSSYSDMFVGDQTEWEREGGAMIKNGELVWMRTGRKLVQGEPGAAAAAHRAGMEFGRYITPVARAAVEAIAYFDLAYDGRLPTANKYHQPPAIKSPPDPDPTKPVKRIFRLE